MSAYRHLPAPCASAKQLQGVLDKCSAQDFVAFFSELTDMSVCKCLTDSSPGGLEGGPCGISLRLGWFVQSPRWSLKAQRITAKLFFLCEDYTCRTQGNEMRSTPRPPARVSQGFSTATAAASSIQHPASALYQAPVFWPSPLVIQWYPWSRCGNGKGTTLTDLSLDAYW